MSETNEMRGDFEAWANSLEFEMHRLNYGYTNNDTYYAWICWQAATERATALERERCARTCDNRVIGDMSEYDDGARACAEYIRQGGAG